MITIACDQGHITAHKTVLCDHSQYLNDILSNYPQAEHPIVILTDLNISDIKVLVNYMYTGELVINTNSSPLGLLNAAQILKIDQLTADTSTTSSSTTSTISESLNSSSQMEDQIPSAASSPTSPELLPIIDDDNQHLNNHHLHHIHHHSSLDDNINLNSNHLNNKQIRCHLCNIGLSDVKCLYRHVLTRHLPEKWGYKCEFCDREFSRDDHLMRHYTTKHKNMEFNRERIRETRRLNREMAKNFHDEIQSVSSMSNSKGNL